MLFIFKNVATQDNYNIVTVYTQFMSTTTPTNKILSNNKKNI